MSVNILIIIALFCLVLIVAYVVAGSCVRYQRGFRTCPEMLPNYIFWRGVMESLRRGFMCLISCGRYRPQPERVVSVMPQVVHYNTKRDTQAFHQLPDEDDVDDDDFGPNDPSVGPIQVRY